MICGGDVVFPDVVKFSWVVRDAEPQCREVPRIKSPPTTNQILLEPLIYIYIAKLKPKFHIGLLIFRGRNLPILIEPTCHQKINISVSIQDFHTLVKQLPGETDLFDPPFSRPSA